MILLALSIAAVAADLPATDLPDYRLDGDADKSMYRTLIGVQGAWIPDQYMRVDLRVGFLHPVSGSWAVGANGLFMTGPTHEPGGGLVVEWSPGDNGLAGPYGGLGVDLRRSSGNGRRGLGPRAAARVVFGTRAVYHPGAWLGAEIGLHADFHEPDKTWVAGPRLAVTAGIAPLRQAPRPGYRAGPGGWTPEATVGTIFGVGLALIAIPIYVSETSQPDVLI